MLVYRRVFLSWGPFRILEDSKSCEGFKTKSQAPAEMHYKRLTEAMRVLMDEDLKTCSHSSL